MDQIIPLLNGLGPWGVVAGVVLTLVAMRVKERMDKKKIPVPTPDVPTPTPAPVPGPVPVPSPTPPPERPVLDMLSQLLLLLLKTKAEKEGKPVEAVVVEAVFATEKPKSE